MLKNITSIKTSEVGDNIWIESSDSLKGVRVEGCTINSEDKCRIFYENYTIDFIILRSSSGLIIPLFCILC